MSKVIVDHTGSVKSNDTGKYHSFTENEAVELPQDAVDALGSHAKSVKSKSEEKRQEVQKEVKDKEDRQVKAGETVTK